MKCIDNLGLRETLTKNGNSFVVGDSQERAIKTAFSSHQNANQNANQSPTELATAMDVLRSTIDGYYYTDYVVFFTAYLFQR